MGETDGVRARLGLSRNPNRWPLQTFDLASDMEVGLEIEASSPDTAWIRKGSEASAILISVDGKL